MKSQPIPPSAKRHWSTSPIARLFWQPTIRATVLALTIFPAAAQNDLPDETAQAGMTQGDVKRDAEAIRAELEKLRDQMRQLMPDDVQLVDDAIKKLEVLSTDQMGGVMTALQEAGTSRDPRSQMAKISEAIKTQRIVSTDLRKLSVDLQARETIESIAEELSTLVRREVSASFEVNRLGRIQQAPVDLRNQDGERYQVANEDQKGVSADIGLLNRKIENLAKEFEADPHNGLVQAAAVSIAENLTAQANRAAVLCGSGPLDQAVQAQTQVIRTLVAMREALATGGQPLDRLRGLAGRLERAAANQKDVMDAVLLIGERQDLERHFKLMQASLGDEVGAVRFELEPLSSQTAGQLVTAGDWVEKTLLNYRRMWEEHKDAKVHVRAALDQMLAALHTLKEQIAQLESDQPQNAAQLAAQLDHLQRDVAVAALQQAQSARQPQPNPAQQQAMLTNVNAYQQRALPVSPEAAKLLGEAAAALPNPTPEAQHDAAVKLAEAARELGRQKAEVTALAQAQAQLDQAEHLAEQAKKKLEAQDTAGATNDLAAAQQQAQEAAKNAKQTNPEAAQAAGQAAGELAQAAQKAAQKDAQAAGSGAAAAQNALAEAKREIARAMAGTPGMSRMAQDKDPLAQPKGRNPQSTANGDGGPSGDRLAGAGETGKPVEVPDGLDPQERAAVTLLQNEKPPREFVPDVRQYYKNIADGAGF